MFRQYCFCCSDYFDYPYSLSYTMDVYQNLISRDKPPTGATVVCRRFYIYYRHKKGVFQGITPKWPQKFSIWWHNICAKLQTAGIWPSTSSLPQSRKKLEKFFLQCDQRDSVAVFWTVANSRSEFMA